MTGDEFVESRSSKGSRMSALCWVAATFATMVALGALAAPPAHAASGSLQFCPYLPYLAKGGTQISKDPYAWTLYQVDDAGHGVVQQQGRASGCHSVEPIATGAYQVAMQGDCYLGGYRLNGTSAVFLVSDDDPAQVMNRINGQWAAC